MSKQLLTATLVMNTISYITADTYSTPYPTVPLAAAPNCSDPIPVTCAAQGAEVCWVYDPLRNVAPWAGSTLAWPQCYSETDPLNPLVCVDNFLCPVAAPYICGRECRNTTIGCDDSDMSQFTWCQGGACYEYPSQIAQITTYTPAPTQNGTNTTNTPQPSTVTFSGTWTYPATDINHGCINQAFLTSTASAGSGIAGATGGVTPTPTPTNADGTPITSSNGTSKVASTGSAIQSTLIATSITAFVAYLL